MEKSIEDAIRAIESLKEKKAQDFIKNVSDAISLCYQKGGKLLIAGNGGSLCDAMHFAEELTGYFRARRKALGAIALADPGHLTCVANDSHFDQVFSRSVEALGRPGDIFIALTTSGNSINLIAATQKAKELNLSTVAFLGKSGGALQGLADFEWIVEGKYSDRIQEAHMTAIHIIIELVERKLFSNGNELLSELKPVNASC
ncbi:MAG: SIS domain-containing protein [Simkaniaceae bacterium]|nr:SIS domain-containing protein [Simkaniaceae bacterium]